MNITFFGLLGYFPCKANDYQLSVTLTDDKALSWAKEIPTPISKGEISSQSLENLICKLSFSQTNLFGKFARAQIRPLYKKLYARNFSPNLSDAESLTLRRWVAVLTSLQPRIPRQCGRRPGMVIYSDAALITRKIAALALVPSDRGRPLSFFRRFHRRSPIIGMEMLAPLAFLWTSQRLLRKKRVNLYIDNDSASNARIRGDSQTPFWRP